MAESNGGGRIDDHEERIKKLEAARREMEDTMIVMAHLESKAAARIKEHAEFIAYMEESSAVTRKTHEGAGRNVEGTGSSYQQSCILHWRANRPHTLYTHPVANQPKRPVRSN